MNKSSNERNGMAVVYDIVNCGPRNRFAVNGKIVSNSGHDGFNVQNLENGSVARTAIEAPPGYVIVVADSSQIELRLNAWWSKEQRVFDILNKGECIYIHAAAAHYGVPYSKFTKASPERKLGKAIVLGSGYGMGAERFKDFCASGPLGMDPMLLTDEEALKAVTSYRATHPNIANNWRTHQEYIRVMYSGIEKQIGPITLLKNAIKLPNGTLLQYFDLRCEESNQASEQWLYNETDYIYGARLQENCIAENTLILTDKGWKLIQEISDDDMVHDGVEYVNHGGLLRKSVQPCVKIDGVFMTLDHEVLTNDGWKTASQNPKPYRPEIREVNGACTETKRQKETVLGVSMRLRKQVYKNRRGSCEIPSKGENTKLRMPHENTPVETKKSRATQTPHICSLEINESKMPATKSSSLEELRGSGNIRMPRMGKFRDFLERHGIIVSTRARPGQDKQQRRIQQTKLPLDNSGSKQPQQEKLHKKCKHPGNSQTNRYTPINTVLQDAPQLETGRTNENPKLHKQVFDILNAGPRQRFVVKGDNGPFIVHNCVQALANVVICDQILALEAEGIQTVSMTHDEILAICPEDQADAVLKRMIEIMSITPDWAKIPDYPTLTLTAEGGYARNYSK